MSLKRVSLLVALSSVVACGKHVCSVDGMGADGGTEVGQRVYFEFDRPKPGQKAALNADQKELARATADAVKSAKDMIIAEGHCDRMGSDEYNDALGERRADAVKKALIDNGVAADRVEVRSMGKRAQPNPNASTPEEDALNRVVIVKRMARA